VNRAGEQLTDWADAWRPYLSAMPTDPQQIARLADRSDDRPRLWTAFDSYARHHAEHAHPEHAQLRATAATAQQAHRHAGAGVVDARRQHEDQLARFGPLAWTLDPAERLADTEHEIAATRQQLTDARARSSQLTSAPALLAQPAARLAVERDTWCAERDDNRRQRRISTARPSNSSPGVAGPRPEPPSLSEPRPSIGLSRGR
jgi:exodeoxyribonuclease V alpha subunit